jgi:chitinase
LGASYTTLYFPLAEKFHIALLRTRPFLFLTIINQDINMKGIALSLAALCISAVSLNSYAISCDTIPQWTSTAVYTKDMQAQQSQKVYKANWWSQNHSPANYSGSWQEWTYQGDCDVAVNHPPVAVLNFTQSSTGYYPVAYTYNFDGSSSYDVDGDPITYSYDGVNFSTDPTKTLYSGGFYDLCEDRYYTMTLTVKDSNGALSTATQRVKIGAAAPGNPWCTSSKSSTSSSSFIPTTSASRSFVSSSASSISSLGLDPCIHPNYVAGASYSQNQVVTNGGSAYRCTVAGWCSGAAWAYAPGTGTYWNHAWELVQQCSVNSSSSVATSASRSSISSGSSSSLGNNIGLPKHALVGYWHNFNNGSGVIRLADVDNTWDVIVIAFADDVGNGTVAFNLDPVLNKAQFIADVAAKRAQGKKVVLSFGGQNGTVTLNNATNVANFVNSTAAIMNEYGFDGIDIDLESGANVLWGAPVIGNIVTAVKQLKQSFPNLYLSMAPEHPYVQGGMIAATGIWGAYLPIIDGLRNELTLLHVQLYNNGGMATPYSSQPLQAGTVDFMVASVKMLVEGFTLANNTRFVGLRPDQVAIGVPSGSRAAGSGFVTITNLNNAVNCLAKLVGCGAIKPNQAYPDFRGVMTWSINWDVADGRPFSVPVNANLDALP